ncbi:MAG TPA: TOBE domain-containing protein, partial [Pseudonocardiaceae bacterium]|nr:TOBE domain-containing protein [Pseudonocardiaceae bacterium]
DMRTEIRLLHQQLGLTTVYVTHDQQEALSLADRLVVLRDGVVQQIGSASDVYETPANAYVAAFVGYRNALTGSAVGARQVRVCGATLTVADDVVGDVLVMIRPDDLVVADDGALPVRVRVCEYQGRYFAVEGAAAGGATVHCHSERAVAPGERVRVTVRPERVRVYPAESAAPADLVGAGSP